MSHYNTKYSKRHVTDLVYKLYIFDIYNLDKESTSSASSAKKSKNDFASCKANEHIQPRPQEAQDAVFFIKETIV